jgi:hypothetical protein
MEMARCDDQDFYDVSDAKRRLPADLRRPGPKRSASASRSQLEQRRADADRYRKSGTEPTLDEMLREPAIRLIMRRDNVTEDQLLSHQYGLPAYQRVSEPGQCLPGIWIHLGMWRDARLAGAQLLEPSHKSRRGVSVRPSRSAQVAHPYGTPMAGSARAILKGKTNFGE